VVLNNFIQLNICFVIEVLKFQNLIKGVHCTVEQHDMHKKCMLSFELY